MSSLPVLDTLADLVRIASVNPAYPGGTSESAVCDYLARFFARHGIATSLQEVFPGRPNLIARLPGRNPARRVILEAHTDTASVAGMSIDPFDPRQENGLLYGRGSCDTKGGLAAMMHALVDLKAAGIVPPCEVWLAAVADEEYSFQGVLKLCEGLRADAAIVAEPTQLRSVVASKGALRWRVHAHGRAAHSSKPHLGSNAISHMARVVLAFEQDGERLAHTPHPLLGPATCNVGVIQGGVQVNFVPDQCFIEVDRRLLPGQRPQDVLAGYRRMLDALQESVPGLLATMDPPQLVDEALETPPDAPPSRLASRVLAEMGLESSPGGVPFGSDASKLARHGVPTLVFGPGSIDRAHAAIEYVEVSEVLLALEFYRRFLVNFE